VNEVLNDLLGGPRSTIMIFNKVDVLEDRGVTKVAASEYQDAQFISARTGEGLDALRRAVYGAFEASVGKFRSQRQGTFKIAEKPPSEEEMQ
jgi:50S ribosomal subunit-associated GTPase HflX